MAAPANALAPSFNESRLVNLFITILPFQIVMAVPGLDPD